MIDLYVKNGLTVNNSKIDVLIDKGKIVDINPLNKNIDAKKVIDLEGKSFVSAGWVDDHVHVYEKLSLYYDTPDKDGVEAGVTTIIDAGSTGADNLPDFYKITRDVKTNVYAMCNISKTGIIAQDELGDLTRIREELVREMIEKYPDFVVGIKARISKSVVSGNGVVPLEEAKKIQAQNHHIPLMVHVGSNPPDLNDILANMTEDDIMTHCFNGKPNGIVDQATGEIKNCASNAYDRGVIFDVGHGTDSFNFAVAEKAFAKGYAPKSISSDLYHRNRENGPVYNLATVMDKMLLIGYSLKDIIKMVTEAPADNFDLKNKGKLRVGYDGDLTIFHVADRVKKLTDSNGNVRTTDRVITPDYAVVAGKVYETELEDE